MVKRIHTLAVRTMVVPRSKLPLPRLQGHETALYSQKIKEMEQTIQTLKQTLNKLTRFQESLLDDGR
jgi:hypothetical protein